MSPLNGALEVFEVGAALLPVALVGYAYVGYPLIVRALASRRPLPRQWDDPPEWPSITITVPCYNEAKSVEATLDRLLALDYPADRRQILVISDCSSDGTDAIVERFSDRGVELLRQPTRRGKTAAENAAYAVARGELIVNVDATTRVSTDGLKALVREFQDPTVGVVSGRDESIASIQNDQNRGESGYVGYEMQLRRWESRVHSIVGASGCFYGIRRALYDPQFPEHLSRDFASVLIVRARGYRAVAADDARCGVARTPGLRNEGARKTRTMERGMDTLWHMRHLMNPRTYGVFSFLLISHKACRWLVYPALPVALVGLALLSPRHASAAAILAIGFALITLGAIGVSWPATKAAPSLVAIPGFLLASLRGGVWAWIGLLTQRVPQATWEPTRRTI